MFSVVAYSTPGGLLKNGTFKGEGQGLNDAISVEVEIEKETIKTISVVSQNKTKGL